MKCNSVLDVFYEEDTLPLRKRLVLAFHIIFCGHCAAHVEHYEETRSVLTSGVFPPSPDFCDLIMNVVNNEAFDEETEKSVFETGGFSTRGWVIAGIIMFLSFVTVFFGQDYNSIAGDWGSSFLLPLGIIIGIVITAYGALFIGSHLKELSQRFKL